jgi:hypothetical protein
MIMPDARDDDSPFSGTAREVSGRCAAHRGCDRERDGFLAHLELYPHRECDHLSQGIGHLS